jgi:hypothetical protein
MHDQQTNHGSRFGIRASMCHASPVRLLSFKAFLVIAGALAASSASAQSDESDLLEARAALERGDAELAIDILEEALQSSGDPALHRHLYLAYEELGDHTRAAHHLEAYLESDATLPEEERASLGERLHQLEASGQDTSDDSTLTVLGWSFLSVGIAGVITFVASASATLVLTNGLPDPCRTDGAMCTNGERAPIDTAWIIAGVGLGTGIVLGTIGAVLLFLAGQDQGGTSQSLPPDLDPSLQRPFSLVPWLDPNAGGGAMLRLRF